MVEQYTKAAMAKASQPMILSTSLNCFIVVVYELSCKGTNKRVKYKINKDFFIFIFEREYFRAKLKGTIFTLNIEH